MDQPSVSSENLGTLIDQLLNVKDPATVGLRRILKTKKEDGASFPCKRLFFEEFDVPGKTQTVFNENERDVFQHEKKIIELENLIAQERLRARTAAQTAFADGEKKGFVLGEKAGYASAHEAFEKKVDELQKKVAAVLKDIEVSKRGVFGNAEHLLLNLACQLTEKIISHELTVNKEIVLSVLKKALGYIADREKIVIRVSPDDLETVSGHKDFWQPVTERLGDISIKADSGIEQGGCIIESNSGNIDARLGLQFVELRDLIEKVWANINAPAPLAPNEKVSKS